MAKVQLRPVKSGGRLNFAFMRHTYTCSAGASVCVSSGIVVISVICSGRRGVAAKRENMYPAYWLFVLSVKRLLGSWGAGEWGSRGAWQGFSKVEFKTCEVSFAQRMARHRCAFEPATSRQ